MMIVQLALVAVIVSMLGLVFALFGPWVLMLIVVCVLSAAAAIILVGPSHVAPKR